MQVFYVAAGRREPIVGVVGALQFDVIASRLRSEYGVEAEIEPAGYSVARWLGDPEPARGHARRPQRGRRRPAGAARVPVRIRMGAAVLPAPPSRRDAAGGIAGRLIYFCSAGIDVAGPMPTICRMHSSSFAPS